MVLARGTVPCTILLIGEAPGESENAIGKPFCGPAGKLLDSIIENASSNCNAAYTYALTNLVACIPYDDDGLKATVPPSDSIKACSVRLQEFVTIARPKLIVCVGQVARDWVDPKKKDCVLPLLAENGIKTIDIMHPAAILRANMVQRGLMVQRAVAVLSTAIEEL